MNEHEHEYQGLLASTWDLLRGDTSQWPDKFFYRDLIGQYGQPVLDVGCGTGRLLIDYVTNGLDVDGVDNSLNMLALCHKKARQIGLQPNLYEQDMASLVLPRKYRTIMVPSCSFQLVTDQDEATRTMVRFHEHLEVGGVLAISFFNISWAEGKVLEKEWKLLTEATRPEDGATVRKWSSYRYEVDEQLQHTQDRYEIMQNGAVIVSEHHRRSPAVRFYRQEQAQQLFEVAGFTNIRIFRGSEWELASVEDSTFTVVGERPL